MAVIQPKSGNLKTPVEHLRNLERERQRTKGEIEKEREIEVANEIKNIISGLLKRT